jgi:hypothetical protein
MAFPPQVLFILLTISSPGLQRQLLVTNNDSCSIARFGSRHLLPHRIIMPAMPSPGPEKAVPRVLRALEVLPFLTTVLVDRIDSP